MFSGGNPSLCIPGANSPAGSQLSPVEKARSGLFVAALSLWLMLLSSVAAPAKSDLCAETARGIIRCLKHCVKGALGVEKAANARGAVRLGRGLGGFEVNTQSHD